MNEMDYPYSRKPPSRRSRSQLPRSDATALERPKNTWDHTEWIMWLSDTTQFETGSTFRELAKFLPKDKDSWEYENYNIHTEYMLSTIMFVGNYYEFTFSQSVTVCLTFIFCSITCHPPKLLSSAVARHSGSLLFSTTYSPRLPDDASGRSPNGLILMQPTNSVLVFDSSMANYSAW